LHDDRRIRILEAQKHVDPVDPDPDPDPQHCVEVKSIMSIRRLAISFSFEIIGGISLKK
jgi:hypothetical protein